MNICCSRFQSRNNDSWSSLSFLFSLSLFSVFSLSERQFQAKNWVHTSKTASIHIKVWLCKSYCVRNVLFFIFIFSSFLPSFCLCLPIFCFFLSLSLSLSVYLTVLFTTSDLLSVLVLETCLHVNKERMRILWVSERMNQWVKEWNHEKRKENYKWGLFLSQGWKWRRKSLWSEENRGRK